jgi:hypothetical protein
MNGYIYLATDGSLYKIGQTINPDQRIYGLITEARWKGREESIKILHTFPCHDVTYAEQYLHRYFAKKRKCGEWFDLTAEDIEVIQSIEEGNDTVFPE